MTAKFVIDDETTFLAAADDLAYALEGDGLDTEALDEVVHEMKAAEAAVINNGGLSDQIAYLVADMGPKAAMAYLSDVFPTSSIEFSAYVEEFARQRNFGPLVAAIAEYDRAAGRGEDGVEHRRAVGRAFGVATSDVNDPDTCAELIWPGPPHPAVGETRVSQARRAAREWLRQQWAEATGFGRPLVVIIHAVGSAMWVEDPTQVKDSTGAAVVSVTANSGRAVSAFIPVETCEGTRALVGCAKVIMASTTDDRTTYDILHRSPLYFDAYRSAARPFEPMPEGAAVICIGPFSPESGSAHTFCAAHRDEASGLVYHQSDMGDLGATLLEITQNPHKFFS